MRNQLATWVGVSALALGGAYVATRGLDPVAHVSAPTHARSHVHPSRANSRRLAPASDHAAAALSEAETRLTASSTTAENDSRRTLARREGAFRGSSAALGGELAVDARGAHVTRRDAPDLELGSSGIACADRSMRWSDARVVARGPDSASIEHGDVVEWYVNGSRGVEQGFDVLRPPGCADGSFDIELSIGSARPVVSDDGSALDLHGANQGTRVARLDALHVHDAHGASVAARFAIRGGRARIHVEAADATYPLVVDPLLSAIEGALTTPYFVDSATGDAFGAALDLDGRWYVVGAPGRDVSGQADAGAVYVFWYVNGNDYRLVQVIPNPQPAPTDRFGASVSILGNRLVVGAPGGSTATVADCGTAFVFDSTGTTFSLTGEIAASSPTNGDLSGISVAQTSDTIFVGASADDTVSGADAGTVSVFMQSPTWLPVQLLTSTTPNADESFGSSIDADGSNLIVGVPGESDPVNVIYGFGNAELYVRSGATWSYSRTFSHPTPAPIDVFGTSVAICGSNLIIGVPGDDRGATLNTGSAFVYEKMGASWNGVVTMQSTALATNAGLGTSVACSGSYVFAGAPYDSPSGLTEAGAVYVAQRASPGAWGAPNTAYQNGMEAGARLGAALAPYFAGAPRSAVGATATAGRAFVSAFYALIAGDAARDGQLGTSVALFGDFVLAGAPIEDATYRGYDSGAAHSFHRTTGVWSGATEIPASTSPAAGRYGQAVALDWSMAAIGAPWRGSPHDGVVEVRSFTDPGGIGAIGTVLTGAAGSGENLGWSLALTPDTLYAGAPSGPRTYAPTYIGIVKAYPRSVSSITSTTPVIIEPPDGEPGTVGFGSSLAANGDLVAVGGSGSTFVFQRNATGSSYPLIARVDDPDGATDFLMLSVAFAGDSWLVVGESGAGSGAVRAGRVLAYPIVRAGGVVTIDQADVQRLTASGSNALGRGVAARPGLIAASDATSVQLFELAVGGTTWLAPVSLVSVGGAVVQSPGAIALSADTIAVGSATDDFIVAPSNTVFQDVGRVHVARLVAQPGAYCASGQTCSTGHCVDGVCCDTSCGGGSLADCQACSVAAGATANGSCSAIALAPAHECRASAGVCDPAETCNGVSIACPSDARAGGSVACRPAADLCDVAEVCDGSSVGCGTDVHAAAATPCRVAAGVCDVAEHCDGNSIACPTDGFAPASSVCRLSAGPCDVPDTCSGSDALCGADLIATAGTTCRPASGACDVDDACDGLGTTCPTDQVATSSVVCRPSAGACDVAESCSGSATTCPSDTYQTDGTTCDDTRICSTSSMCQSGACVASATLACDDGNACTTDTCTEPSGCAHVPACAQDAGVTTDAGSTPTHPAQGGCSCSVANDASPRSTLVALLLLTFAMGWRTRRARGRSTRDPARLR